VKDQGNGLRRENDELRQKLAALRKEIRDLKRSVKECHQLIQGIPAGVAVVQEGKLIECNQGLSRFLGYDSGDLAGKDFLEIFHPDVVNEVRELQRRRLAGKTTPNRYETYLKTSGDERVCCEVRVKKIRYRGKRAIVVSVFDLDRRKRGERQTLRDEKMKALARMAAGIREELAACAADLEVPRSVLDAVESANPDLRKLIENVGTARRGETRVIRQLESLSAGPGAGEATARFDLSEVVKQAITDVGPVKRAMEKAHSRIHLKTYFRPIPKIEGNPQKIREAVRHLIVNAIEAMPGGGEIHLSTEQDGAFAYVYVQDNGKGISNAVEDKIFDPFFTSKGENPGLGLSLAQASVRGHGGDVEVLRGQGHGSTFTMKMPISRGDRQGRKRGSKNWIKDSFILLLAEDGIVKELLSQSFLNKGARVSSVTNIRDCLHYLRKDKFSVLIADCAVSGPNVPLEELIRKVKETEQGPSVVVVNVEPGGEIPGADLSISRPLALDKIVSQVSEVIEMREAP